MMGYEDYNFPLFDEARDQLIKEGWDVVSPADLDRMEGIHENSVLPAGFMRGAMTRDLSAVCTVDTIVLLPKWRFSRGARVEAHLGLLLGLEFLQYSDQDSITVMDPSDVAGELMNGLSHEFPIEVDENPFDIVNNETILQEAHRLCTGDRNKSYGNPEDDYARTAKIMSAIIGHDINAYQAALCMVAVKLSRAAHSHSHDTMVDGAGYFYVADRCATKGPTNGSNVPKD